MQKIINYVPRTKNLKKLKKPCTKNILEPKLSDLLSYTTLGFVIIKNHDIQIF